MRKTWSELAVALGAMMGVTMAAGLNILGIYNTTGDQNDPNPGSGDPTHGNRSSNRSKDFKYIIAGNALNVMFSFLCLYVLWVGTDELGAIRGPFTFAIFVGIVIEAYLTFMNLGNKNNDIANYFFIGLDTLVKLIAVMLGYGVMQGSPILGGRKRG